MRLLADEDLNHDIVRGLKRRRATLDIVTVQELGLRGLDDDAVLVRAALEDRILLTHDINTLVERALTRVRAGQVLPGVLVVPQWLSVGAAIEDLSGTTKSCICRCDDPDH